MSICIKLGAHCMVESDGRYLRLGRWEFAWEGTSYRPHGKLVEVKRQPPVREDWPYAEYNVFGFGLNLMMSRAKS